MSKKLFINFGYEVIDEVGYYTCSLSFVGFDDVFPNVWKISTVSVLEAQSSLDYLSSRVALVRSVVFWLKYDIDVVMSDLFATKVFQDYEILK